MAKMDLHFQRDKKLFNDEGKKTFDKFLIDTDDAKFLFIKSGSDKTISSSLKA